MDNDSGVCGSMTGSAPKVAILLPSLRGGGAEKSFLNLARGLAERGMTTELVLISAVGPLMADVPRNVRVVDLKASRVALGLPKLVSYLSRSRPSALLATMDHLNVVALLARRIAGVDTRIGVRTATVMSQATRHSHSIKQRLVPILARWTYRWADWVIAVSDAVAKDLSQIIRLPRSRIHVIHYPILSDEFIGKMQEAPSHPWFTDGGPPIVLAVGRLERVKDFPTLILAFNEVRAKQDARLVIMGEGTERPRLERLVKKLGLEENVSLPGFQNNPYAHMARAAVFVISSLYEGMPVALAEALACGTPVVSTDCPGGVRELLAGGLYGRLCPVGDPHAMAEAILQSMNDPHPAHLMRYRMSDFSEERVVDDYIKLLGLDTEALSRRK